MAVKTAVLVSGGGTNLQALINARDAGELSGCDLCAVVSSNPGASALSRAEAAGIPAYVTDRAVYPDREKFTRAVTERLVSLDIGLVVLAGFMFVLSREFTDRFENRIINVHPSLIPAFSGDGFYGVKVHQAALDYGVKLTGATVHFVNHITDGGAIIMQKSVPVIEGDTPETLQLRVMEQAEWEILPQAVSLFCQGRLTIDGRVVRIS